MSDNLKINLPELVDAGILDAATAERITEFYRKSSSTSGNRLLIIFSVLGALLVGLGIILIVAHNWDQFGKGTKTLFAFLPMLIGQGLCGYTLLRQKEQIAWREASATFLVFALGACLSLVSQIYNLSGTLAGFLLTWILLGMPLIYIMRSSMVSVLYIAAITWYACEKGYWSYPSGEVYEYWALLALALPWYYQLFRRNPKSNTFHIHSWLLALSVVICLGLLALHEEYLIWLAYAVLFGVYFLLGNLSPFAEKRLFNNPFRVIGAVGVLFIFFIHSFDWFWSDLYLSKRDFSGVWYSPEFWVSLGLIAVGGWLLSRQNWSREIWQNHPLTIAFPAYTAAFLMGMVAPTAAVILINLFLLGIGVYYLYMGNDRNHLGWLNFGLIILAILLTCRFFDWQLSFVTRGILFVLLGIGFLLSNLRLLRKRKILQDGETRPPSKTP